MPQTNYRVWCIVNPPNPPDFYPVDDPKRGAKVIDLLARQQLRMPWIYSNVMGLEIFEDGEWTDWYDENGDSVDVLCEV